MKVPEKIRTRTTTANLDRTLNTPPPLCPSVKFHVQEPLGIADHDLLIDCRIEIEAIKRLDVHRNCGKRRVGREYHPLGSEEADTARQPISDAEHRAIKLALLELF